MVEDRHQTPSGIEPESFTYRGAWCYLMHSARTHPHTQTFTEKVNWYWDLEGINCNYIKYYIVNVS